MPDTTRHGFGAGFPHVAGHCPACGKTCLFVGDGGLLTCAWSNCPNPAAASELFDDAETEHIVWFDTAEFTIRHPLRERLGDALLDCDLHHHIAGLSGPPVRPGRYRARLVDGRWTWEEATLA